MSRLSDSWGLLSTAGRLVPILERFYGVLTADSLACAVSVGGIQSIDATR